MMIRINKFILYQGSEHEFATQYLEEKNSQNSM